MDEQQLNAILAATIQGDRWLDAEACALFVMAKSTRAFKEGVACKPGFPRPVWLNGSRRWKKSEVDKWMERQRASQAA